MKKRYDCLYFDSIQNINESKKEQSSEDKKLIEETIKSIEQLSNMMSSKKSKETKNKAKEIYRELDNLKDAELSIDQVEKLTSFNLEANTNDDMSRYIISIKKFISRKYVNAINNRISQINDLEELKKIYKDVYSKKDLDVNVLIIKLNNKIMKLQQQEVAKKIRNDVSPNIRKIINDLVAGTGDIDSITAIIQEEARIRVASKPKTKFSLTEEQEKKQILVQIRTIISENPEKYYVENPEKTIKDLQSIGLGNEKKAIEVVGENLIRGKRFEEAKKVCNEFLIKSEENEIDITIRDLKRKIKNAEIGDLVLKGLKMDGTKKEKVEFFKKIEEGIRLGNVKTLAVKLGKSQNGTREITLADIYGEDRIIE